MTMTLSLAQTDHRHPRESGWFRSWEVCRACGATPRQLQWWDERGILQPAQITKHRRLYSEEQLNHVRRMVELRKAGVPLQEIRKRKLLTLPWKSVRSGRRPFLVGDILVVPLT